MQIEYTQATTESFGGKASHDDIVGNTAGGVEVIPPAEERKTLVSQITGADYGKTINYKATVQGQEVSNWKVFLNDRKNVYIILDDYLPNILVPAETGLTKGDSTKPYSIWHTSSRDALVSSLTTQSYWSEFANGVLGATATGGPTNAQLVASWNDNPVVNSRKIQTETIYWGTTNGGPIIDPTKLYVTHTENLNECAGYWLTSPCTNINTYVWRVNYYGNVGRDDYNTEYFGIRPLVCLPSILEGTVGVTVEI